MPTNWNIQWLNHNSQRNYPLADDASGLDQSGSFKLPTDFIVELDLPVHAGMDVDPARFFIKHVGVYSTGYSVIVGYQPGDGSDPVNVATALISKQTHTSNTTYALGGVAPFTDTIGKVVIGELASIDDQPPGFWTFDLEATRLDPDASRPIIRGVSSIVLVNGDQRSEPLYGVVELVAGNNCQLVPIIVSGQDPVVRINFLQGEGTIEDCVCEGDAAATAPIKRIFGIAPTSEGDFSIIGGECVQVEAIENGIRISDTCSKPCCSCPELEKITSDLQRIQQQSVNVSAFVDEVKAANDTMSFVVLGARLNDRGCVTCE